MEESPPVEQTLQDGKPIQVEESAVDSSTTLSEADVPAQPEASSSRPPQPRKPRDNEPQEPLEEVLRRRVTKIKEGDNVLLRLPSDTVKAVVATKDGLVQLGKFGAFPAKYLLGLHYDITYEIVPNPDAPANPEVPAMEEEAVFGQAKGKKNKKKGGKKGGKGDAPGFKNMLRPLRPRGMVDAVIGEL